MLTVGPVNMMVAPCPLLIVMPASLIEMSAPVAVLSRMPPVGPGMSEIISVFCMPVCSTMLGDAGTPACTSAGTSAALPQKPPTHTGWPGSPCSNSTHTPAPTCGTQNMPACTPVHGTQAIAQLDRPTPSTSGT